jgi:hypothetical protein
VNGTDYVVRTWQLTPAGHARATVVDMHGRIVHVTVHRAHAPHGDIDAIIRERLAALPPHRLRSP